MTKKLWLLCLLTPQFCNSLSLPSESLSTIPFTISPTILLTPHFIYFTLALKVPKFATLSRNSSFILFSFLLLPASSFVFHFFNSFSFICLLFAILLPPRTLRCQRHATTAADDTLRQSSLPRRRDDVDDDGETTTTQRR